MKDESQVKGSWRSAKGGYIYLAAEDFDEGEGYALTIKEVMHEEVIDQIKSKGKNIEKKDVFSCSFDETDRKMSINATRARQIADIAGSNKVENWGGVKVYVHRTEKVYFGKPGSLEVRGV